MGTLIPTHCFTLWFWTLALTTHHIHPLNLFLCGRWSRGRFLCFLKLSVEHLTETHASNILGILFYLSYFEFLLTVVRTHSSLYLLTGSYSDVNTAAFTFKLMCPLFCFKFQTSTENYYNQLTTACMSVGGYLQKVWSNIPWTVDDSVQAQGQKQRWRRCQAREANLGSIPSFSLSAHVAECKWQGHGWCSVRDVGSKER